MLASLHSPTWLVLAQADDPLGFIGPLIPFILIGVLFYFMIFRTERRRRAQMAEMLSNLKKNDRVLTIGGIFGTVVNVPKGAEEITLRIDENNNTRIRVQRSAIARILTESSSAATDAKESEA